MKQNRFRSVVAWVTLLPIIILLGNTYGLWEIIKMDADTFTKIFNSLMAALVAFGLFNNPQNKTGY